MPPRRRPSSSLAAQGALCGAFAAVVLAHAGLLGRSRWQGDEYIVFAYLRLFGWAFLKDWYLGWSPRLVSDALFAAYGGLVLALHRPLAGSCMAVLWAGLLAACVGPAWLGGGAGLGVAGLGAADRLARLGLGLGLFALFLVGGPVTEVFYWPAGGLSYLPTLAGVTWLFWCVVDGVAGARRWQAAAALMVVAGSSEVGILFVLAFCGCVGLAGCGPLTLTLSPKEGEGKFSSLGKVLGSLWWMAPGLGLACLDLGLVWHGRASQQAPLAAGPSLAHHPGASLLAALPRFGAEFWGGQDHAAASTIMCAAAAKLLVLLGGRWSCARTGVRGNLLLAFAAALLFSAYASIAAAFDQYGVLCCERHETVRQVFMGLALVAVGAWSAQVWRPARLPGARAGLPLLAAVCLVGFPRARDLAAEYRLRAASVPARALTWQSGLRTDSAGMVLMQAASGPVIAGVGFPPGVYRLDGRPDWAPLGIMTFFRKTTLTIRPP